MSTNPDGAANRRETTTADRSTTGRDAPNQSERQSQQAPGRTAAPAPGGAGVSLVTEAGSTRIGDGVVAKIAGLAARDIPGVFSMGSGMARRVGQLKSLIPGSTETASQGVAVEVGEREAAIDLNLVTWYGQSIVEISDAVRRNVVGQVEGMTGLHVVEVNIQVDDVHVESASDNQPEAGQRVQ